MPSCVLSFCFFVFWRCKNIDTTNHGYYTSDATYDANTYAWYVREEGFFECTWVNENEWAGIRPVITVEKEKLKY